MLNKHLMNKFKFCEKKLNVNVNRYLDYAVKFLFISIIISAALCTEAYSQNISVSGKIMSGRIPIQNASVTFIDNADTTSKFSTVTDASGNYEINLTITSVNQGKTLPTNFQLEQNYPNPFSSNTNIPYGLNKVSDVKVTIYDILGRVVRKFNVGWQSAGAHSILWNGLNNTGQKVATGVYFYRLHADGEPQVKKMVFNQNGSGLTLSPGSFSSVGNSLPAKSNLLQKIQGNTFTIRVQNTSITTPLIVSEELKNVIIQKDTTINFYVTYIPLATINLDSLHQVIRGFGAASPWYLPVMTDSEIQSAFGTANGQIGLSIFRITVEADSNLWAKWVPSAKKAQDMGAKIIASPWYAPSNLTETRNSEVRIKLDKYNEYAAHLNSFVKYMKINGVSIYGLSVQNEPNMGNWTNWSPNEMFNFMKDYAGKIEGTNVMAPEVSNFARSYSDLILNDSTACANTDIICGHIYGGGLAKYPLAEQKGKEVWMTEYLMGENNSGNNLSWAIKLAKNINDVMQANMSAYVWWTLVRYYGPIGDGTKASNPQDPNERYPAKGEVTKKGYVMSQFSKFIRPGYFRVESKTYPFSGNASVTAYKDPSSSKVVIIAINSGSTEVENAFRIGGDSMLSTLSTYTTSETKNCEQGNPVNVVDGVFKYTLEPMSITTLVSE